MPFNGSGVFAPPGADFPAVANTLIEASKFNNVINDIATGLSTCITVDGQSTVTNNIPFGGNRLTGIGAPAATGDALREGSPVGGTTPAPVTTTALIDTGSGRIDGDLQLAGVNGTGGHGYLTGPSSVAGKELVLKAGNTTGPIRFRNSVGTSLMALAEDGTVGVDAILKIGATLSPASNGTGSAGQIAWDGSYLYICVAANTWRRVATTGGY